MKFTKAALINIAEAHFDTQYWDAIDRLVESRVSVQRDDPDLLDKIADADVLFLGFQVPVGKDIIDAMPNLRLINILATAYGTVDLAAASARGIPVCNLGGYSTEAVAEFTIAAILYELRGMAEGLRRAQTGDWSFTGIHARELKGSRFGVIGLGNIGGRVAELAAGFGAEVSYWSRSKKDVTFSYQPDLDALLASCDIVSINVAETDDTRHLLHAGNLPLIPKDAIVINTVPPTVIDTDALCTRLEQNDMRFVFVNHPYPTLEPELARIHAYPNVTGYPAIGFITDEARTAKQEVFIANATNFLRGTVQHQVN